MKARSHFESQEIRFYELVEIDFDHVEEAYLAAANLVTGPDGERYLGVFAAVKQDYDALCRQRALLQEAREASKRRRVRKKSA